MNKIIYHTKPGTTGFFLMNVPEEPVYLPLNCACNACRTDYSRKFQKYTADLQSCKEEAIKNGEITNPEIIYIIELRNDHPISTYWKYKDTLNIIRDGDTFDLPKGLKVEEVKLYSDCQDIPIIWSEVDDDDCIQSKTVICLVPSDKEEKEPVESQDELFDSLGKILHHDITSNGWEYDKHTAMSLFTITRKEK